MAFGKGFFTYNRRLLRKQVLLQPPAQVTGLAIAVISDSELTASWDNVDGETGFEVQRSPDDSTWAEVATPGQDVLSFADTGLNDNTTYYYRVRAVTGALAGPWSASASATTLISWLNSTPAAITPTKTHVNDNNATSDPAGNEANATTGWSPIGVTLVSQAAEKDTGSYAFKLTALDGTSDRADKNTPSNPKGFNYYQVAHKRGTGTNQWVTTPAFNVVPGAAWATTKGTEKYVSGSNVRLWAADASGGAPGDELYADNIAMATLSDLYVAEAEAITGAGWGYAHWHVADNMHAGLDLTDGTDKILIFIEKLAAKIAVREYVGAVWADVANASFTYDAAKAIYWELLPGTTRIVIGYDTPANIEAMSAAQRISNALIDNNTLSSATLSAINVLQLFSTDASNDPQAVRFAEVA